MKLEHENISNEITEITKKNDKLSLQKSKMEDNKDLKMKISNFIQDKDLEKNLIYIIQNLERKDEVIDFKYRKARKYLKKQGEEIKNIEATEIGHEKSIRA